MSDPSQALVTVILGILLLGYVLAVCSPVDDEPYTVEEVREPR